MVLGVRKDKIINEWVRVLCGVEKVVDGRINECVLNWFGHIERMVNRRTTKRVYNGVCILSESVCQP